MQAGRDELACDLLGVVVTPSKVNLTVLPNRVGCSRILVSRLTNTTWIDDMCQT
jgi:hypothetical protein